MNDVKAALKHADIGHPFRPLKIWLEETYAMFPTVRYRHLTGSDWSRFMLKVALSTASRLSPRDLQHEPNSKFSTTPPSRPSNPDRSQTSPALLFSGWPSH